MAEPWGVTETGFYRPVFEELQDKLGTKLRAYVHPDLDLGDETMFGQHNGISNRSRALVWEVLETCYHSYDADSAEGVLFENLGKLTGVGLEPAKHSLATISVTLSAEDTLETDVTYIAHEDREDVRFTPVESVTKDAGTHDILFRSENTGPVAAAAGKLTVISSGPAGLVSATNAEDAQLGSDAETIEELRARRDESIAIVGGSTEDAILADVDDLGFVLNTNVLSNYGPVTDANGLPPHSYEVIVWTGADPTENQRNTIAQTIFDTGPDGIQTWGTHTGTATDESGETITIRFTVAQEVTIWIEAELTKQAGAAADSETKEAWAAAMNAQHEPGQSVVALVVRSWPLSRDKITDVPSFTIGTTASPVGEDNLPITVRQIARFDTTRIAITTTP